VKDVQVDEARDEIEDGLNLTLMWATELF